MTFRRCIPMALAVLATVTFCRPGLASQTGRVFVSNEDSDDIAVLDPASDYSIVARIKTGRRPRDLHFTDDHKNILVACGDSDRIDVIDVDTLKVTGSIPTGASPEIFLIAPPSRIYVSNEDTSSIGVIDMALKKQVATIETGAEPEGLALSGNTLYATSEMSDVVHVIDSGKNEVTANIIVGTRPRRLLTLPDLHELWVTNELSGDVGVIDTTTNSLTQMLSFDPPGFRHIDVTPVGLTRSHDRKTVFVTLGRANHVAIVDAKTKKVKAFVLVGTRAWGVAVSRDDRLLFVTNGLSDDLSIIDVASRRAIKSIPVGRTPHSVIVDD